MTPASPEHPIAILGATGQLGSDLIKVAEARDLAYVALGHDAIEIRDAKSVRNALESISPSVIVNSAAFHAVPRCEEDPQQAFDVNALGALNVARAADELGARVLYVSTDYVFDGRKPGSKGETTPTTAYAESDATGPLNVYGSSKRAGEELTLQALDDSLVCRVSSLFGVAGARGKGGGNFIDTMLGLAEKYPDLKGVDDQIMTPTYTRHAAEALLDLALTDETGIVHVTNPEACTWYDLAEHALRTGGYDNPIEPVPHTAFPSPAERPANSALLTARLKGIRGPLASWREAVEAYLKEKENLSDDPKEIQ